MKEHRLISVHRYSQITLPLTIPCPLHQSSSGYLPTYSLKSPTIPFLIHTARNHTNYQQTNTTTIMCNHTTHFPIWLSPEYIESQAHHTMHSPQTRHDTAQTARTPSHHQLVTSTDSGLRGFQPLSVIW